MGRLAPWGVYKTALGSARIVIDVLCCCCSVVVVVDKTLEIGRSKIVEKRQLSLS